MYILVVNFEKFPNSTIAADSTTKQILIFHLIYSILYIERKEEKMNCKDCLHKNVCYTVALMNEYRYDLNKYIERFGCDDYMDYAEWVHTPKREKTNMLSKRFRRGSH